MQREHGEEGEMRQTFEGIKNGRRESKRGRAGRNCVKRATQRREKQGCVEALLAEKRLSRRNIFVGVVRGAAEREKALFRSRGCTSGRSTLHFKVYIHLGVCVCVCVHVCCIWL